MQPLERLMRAMTHLNIGAAIAMLAWVFWSGLQVVAGDTPPTRQAATAAAATAPATTVAMPPQEERP